MLLNNIEINVDFKQALHLLENEGKNVFVTGNAGTGKSTFLKYFLAMTEITEKKEKAEKKNIVLLAPTGIAALNIKGSTIHSFFRFSPNITEHEAKKRARFCQDPMLYKSVTTIVIDEISMVRADLLDCIDVFLRTVRKRSRPFGGVQVLFIGDLYQLPPIVKNEEKPFFEEVYEGPYFFNAKVFNHSQFTIEYLDFKKIYRQQDPFFIQLLNEVRNKTITYKTLNTINTKVIDDKNKVDDHGHIYLSSTNEGAKKINHEKLSALKGKVHQFEAILTEGFSEKDRPTETELILKIGAQVMFLNNASGGTWVNGSIGEIQHIDTKEGIVIVKMDTGSSVEVTPYTWSVYRYIYDSEQKTLTQETVGTFTQVPLKLAWAITIHKSQGKSFSHVIVDLERGAFASGQTYVALSRCRTLEGLRLTKPLRISDIRIDPKVIHFTSTFKTNKIDKPDKTDNLEKML